MKRIFTFLAVMLLVALAESAERSSYQATWHVTNGTISVTASARDAGAVSSLVYDGMEFINDMDHGRQMQVAWFYDDLDEAYNPTESGAESDGRGPTSTSRLVSVKVDGKTLQTQSHPAFWRDLSVPKKHRKNTTLVTKDLLSKKLTLGYNNDPHIIVFDTTITISPELTGPPVKTLRIEAPTLYSNSTLSRHSQYDLASGEFRELPAHGTMKDQMNEVIRHVTRHDLIPILSTPDGRHAIALYAPHPEVFWAYYTHDVPSDDPANACGKITAFFKHAVEPGRSYSYRTFIIVGDLAIIKASVSNVRSQTNDTNSTQRNQ